MKRYIICILCLLAIWNCEDDDINGKEMEMRNSFQHQTSAGIYMDGAAIAVYDQEKHQLAFTDDRRSWRFQSDDLSFYLSCQTSETPELDKIVDVSIKARGMKSLEDCTGRGYVTRQENDKYWLWMPEINTGIILQFNNQ